MSGNHVKVLFVCASNRLRSPTAAFLWSFTPNITTRSRGTDWDLQQDDIDWADIVIALNPRQQALINKHFTNVKKLVALDLPDKFDYLDPRLFKSLPILLADHLPQPVLPKRQVILQALQQRAKDDQANDTDSY